MDNTEEIQKLVGQLVIDAYLSKLQAQYQLKDLLTENAQLKEQQVQLRGSIDGSGQ